MQMQPNVVPNVPTANCPQCAKKWPMAIRSASALDRGKQSVEFICKNCGVTLVRECGSQ